MNKYTIYYRRSLVGPDGLPTLDVQSEEIMANTARSAYTKFRDNHHIFTYVSEVVQEVVTTTFERVYVA